jgi:hypothetical protein
MISQLSLPARLAKVLIPTKGQAFLTIFLAFAALVAMNIRQAYELFGINHATLDTTLEQFHDQYSTILNSQLASSTALVTFWASVGLIAYLICWSAYNVLIEARNEVTLETQYTNKGGHHWRGPYETAGLKAVGATALVAAVMLFKPGLALWLALGSTAFVTPNLTTILTAAGAVLGLAAQIYLVLAMVMVTFTPWYRKEAFTEQF